MENPLTVQVVVLGFCQMDVLPISVGSQWSSAVISSLPAVMLFFYHSVKKCSFAAGSAEQFNTLLYSIFLTSSHSQFTHSVCK